MFAHAISRTGPDAHISNRKCDSIFLPHGLNATASGRKDNMRAGKALLASSEDSCW